MNQDNNDSPPLVSEGLGMLFHRTARLMARAYHRRDHAHHAQNHVLSIIREHGSINQGELLEILDVRSSSLSEVLGKLELNGLITRARNEKDRRSFVVTATEQAETAPTSLGDSEQESSNALFSCLDDTEREQLRNILEKIADSLKDDLVCREPFQGHTRGKGRKCKGNPLHGRGGRGGRSPHGRGRG